jgi:hypothetical protein
MCVWSTPNTDDIPAAFPPFEKAAGFRFDGGAGAMDVEVKERLEALERLLRPADLVQKVRLRLLHDLVPKAVRVAVLVNPANAAVAEPTLRDVQEAAPTIGLQIRILNATTMRWLFADSAVAGG